ncbi:WD40 repeat-like protein [Clavulina sp. PMI_390]|nr:WD40 repeat-like protein [Clavulina sp. PMI_390]
MSPGSDEQPPVPKRTKKEKLKGKEKAQPEPEEPVSTGIPSWAWALLADSQPASCPPVFTKDAKYFFVASSASVKIYSVATTRVVSTLNPFLSNAAKNTLSSSSTITGLLISPQNPFQLVTASDDGCIRIWDFLDAVLLRTIQTDITITRLASHHAHKDLIFVVGKGGKKHSMSHPSLANRFKLFRVSIVPSVSPEEPVHVERYQHASFGSSVPSGLVISPSGASIVVTSGKTVFVIGTEEVSGPVAEYQSPDPLTCLAFHPTDELFATGDTDGIIRLWYVLDSRGPSRKNGYTIDRRRTKAPTVVMHWHAHAVRGIAFSPNGTYLLSGGEESVLVIWQLQNSHREFIPRLGAPIDHVTIMPQSSGMDAGYLLSLNDGGLSLVDSTTLKVSRTFIQLKRSSHTSSPSNQTSAPLAVHPITQHLVLPSSHPSSLQIYAPQNSELISELEVSSSNRVSRKDDDELEHARVTHAAICPNGEWLATVDWRRGGSDFGDEIVLKIWRSTSNGSWVLNSRIDKPHGKEPVTKVQWSPQAVLVNGEDEDAGEFLLLTVAENGILRTWKHQETYDGEVYWATRSTFSYRKQRASDAVWSPDASLIAVAHGPSVTLWEPISNILIQSLACAEAETILNVCFLGASGRYLATYSGSDIITWDLLSNTIVWSYRIRLERQILVPHPTEDSFAIIGSTKSKQRPNDTLVGNFTKRSLIAVFGSNSSQPLRSYSVPFILRNALWYENGASRAMTSGLDDSPASYSLLGVTATHAAVVLGDKVDIPVADGSDAREIGVGTSAELSSLTQPSLFTDIFGASAFASLEQRGQSSNVETSRVLPAAVGAGGVDLALLDGPAHLLPPISSLFDDLMKSFTQPHPIGSEDEDVEMVDAEEMANPEPLDVEDHSTKSESLHMRKAREVDGEEMTLFTEAFRTMLANNPSQPFTPSSKQTNGVANGHAPHSNGKANGHHLGGKASSTSSPAKSKHKKGLNGLSTPLRASSLSETSTVVGSPTSTSNVSLSPTTGQKRKKSST